MVRPAPRRKPPGRSRPPRPPGFRVGSRGDVVVDAWADAIRMLAKRLWDPWSGPGGAATLRTRRAGIDGCMGAGRPRGGAGSEGQAIPRVRVRAGPVGRAL